MKRTVAWVVILAIIIGAVFYFANRGYAQDDGDNSGYQPETGSPASG
jgi:hypothetical protein